VGPLELASLLVGFC